MQTERSAVLGDELLFEVEGTIRVVHHPEEQAAVATWWSLRSSDVRSCLERGLNEAARLSVVTWIADLTRDPGVPSQEDLQWMKDEAVPLCKRSGVRAVINVLGASKVARLGPKRWTKSLQDVGISVYDCESLRDALALAREIAGTKAS
jgi:hypothetical protein